MSALSALTAHRTSKPPYPAAVRISPERYRLITVVALGVADRHRHHRRRRPAHRLGPRLRRLAELQRRAADRCLLRPCRHRAGQPAVHRPRRGGRDRRRARVAVADAPTAGPHVAVARPRRRRRRPGRARRHHRARRPPPAGGPGPHAPVDGARRHRRRPRAPGGRAGRRAPSSARRVDGPPARVGAGHGDRRGRRDRDRRDGRRPPCRRRGRPTLRRRHLVGGPAPRHHGDDRRSGSPSPSPCCSSAGRPTAAPLQGPLASWIFVGLLQSAIGYTQYFNEVPAALVAVHVAGATALWAMTVWLVLSTRATAAVPAARPSIGRGAGRSRYLLTCLLVTAVVIAARPSCASSSPAWPPRAADGDGSTADASADAQMAVALCGALREQTNVLARVANSAVAGIEGKSPSDRAAAIRAGFDAAEEAAMAFQRSFEDVDAAGRAGARRAARRRSWTARAAAIEEVAEERALFVDARRRRSATRTCRDASASSSTASRR